MRVGAKGSSFHSLLSWPLGSRLAPASPLPLGASLSSLARMQIDRPGLIVADRWQDYRLLDCGDGMKQEQWGPYNLVRPDPQIIWPKTKGKTWTGWDGF